MTGCDVGSRGDHRVNLEYPAIQNAAPGQLKNDTTILSESQ